MVTCGPVSGATRTPDPILVIVHQEHSTAGRIGQMLAARGYTLDVRRPRFGNPLPRTMARHAGAIILGGPMSANDEEEFIRQEIDWLAVPLSENKPFLGVCLGAQMLVRHLGGKVAGDPQGRVEIGYYPIRPTRAGRALCSKWPEQVYQWHREGIDLPAGSELLAQGETFPVQAFRQGSGYGLQFHPEITYATMCRWMIRSAERLSLPGAKPPAAHFQDRAVYDFAIRAWLTDFLAQWILPPQPGVASTPLPCRIAEASAGLSAATGAGLAAAPGGHRLTAHPVAAASWRNDFVPVGSRQADSNRQPSVYDNDDCACANVERAQ